MRQALAAIGLALAAGATPSLVQAAPKPAALAPIELPYETFTLKNGLRVIVHTDRKAPVVGVGIWYGVGSRDEKLGRTGFAHLFEHLMFNGSEHYNKDFFGPFEEVGATDQNGTTWFDRTNYFQTVPTPALDMTLWMESDRMGHLLGAIDQAKLEEQRGVVKNEKRQGDNEPYGLVEYAILGGLFPNGHPYSWSTIGSMEDLDAASLDDVKTWFRNYYGASNAVLALAGDIDAATAKPLVEKYFGDIDPGPPVTRRESDVPVRLSNTRDVLRDRVPQPRIYRVWATPGRTTQENATLDLAASILGQGKTSRLYKALVYDQKVATNVVAFVDEHELATMLNIQVTLKPGQDMADVTRRMDAEIANFLAKGPTQAELDRVRTRDYAAFARGIEKVGGFEGKMTVLAEGWLYADDPGFYKQRLAWMRDASTRDVRDTARKYMGEGWHQVDVVPFGDAAASDGGADRSKIPSVAAAPELNFPAIQQATLANGAKLVVAQRKGAPLVEVAAVFDGGYTADAGRKLGTASFTMAMLDEGTATRSALEIPEEAEALGATIGTGAGIETSNVRLSALKDRLAPSLALMADVVRNPAFEQKEIDRVRTIWLAGITQEKASPQTLALRLLPSALYGEGNPYGVPLTGSGTEASIASLMQDDLRKYHAERIRPDNATFYVVGDVSVDEIKAELDKAFAGWSAPSTPVAKLTAPAALKVTKPRLIIVDRPNAPQSFILAGRATTPANAEDALAQEVMNDAFGGMFSARLNMNLREAKGWSYGAYSGFTNTRNERPWLIYAPVQTDKTKESVAELRKELVALNKDLMVSDAELKKVLANSSLSLPGSFETSPSVLNALTGPAAVGRPLDWYPSLPGRYKTMTLAEARAAAKAIVDPNVITWIVVGDRAKIETGLKSLNIAPIEVWDENGKVVK